MEPTEIYEARIEEMWRLIRVWRDTGTREAERDLELEIAQIVREASR